MQSDGSYLRSRNPDLPALRFQERFYEILLAENSASSAKGIPID
jgi:hypothetical protein